MKFGATFALLGHIHAERHTQLLCNQLNLLYCLNQCSYIHSGSYLISDI